VTLLIGVASGVITGLALAGLTAQPCGGNFVHEAGLRGGARRARHGVPDSAWVQMEAGLAHRTVASPLRRSLPEGIGTVIR
jgi:hypothetical protein